MHRYNYCCSESQCQQKKTCKDADGDHNYLWSNNTELQWCIGVANNYTCYLQLYKLVPVLFIPVQLCTFLMF